MINIIKNNTNFYISEESIQIKWWFDKYPTWENQTFQIIDDLVDNTKTFIDIGAWIGPISLYIAPKIKRIIAIDCDHIAIESLFKNVHCNDFKDKFEIEYSALFNKNKLTYVGGGKRKAEWGKSGIALTDAQDTSSRLVNGITIDSLIQKYGVDDCGFVKMDIEGGEGFIIDSMENFFITQKPIFYISLHPHLLILPRLAKTISSLFRIFPFVYNTHYELLKEEDTLDLFSKNKIDIENELIPGRTGNELICTFKAL